MNSANTVEVRNDRSRLGRIAAEWYSSNPEVRRLWVYETSETDPADASDIYIIVALTPVCDSDDVSPVWLARCHDWETELQGLVGRPVHLDWFNADTGIEPCADDTGHSRVCLASIAWRDCCTVP